MKYNFDKIINRENTNAIRYEYLERFFGTKDLLPLWVADMDFEVASEIVETIQERVKHPIFGYSARTDKFFNSISNWLKSNYDWDVKKSDIEFTPGVLAGIVSAVHEFTSEGDGIIIQTPVYPPFHSIVKENKRNLLCNSLIEKDLYYTIDFEDFEEKAKKENVKMFILCNPHNPVGRAWKYDELKKLVEICHNNDVIIVSDEIHSDLCLFDNKHIPIGKAFPEYNDKIITCMAPSKTFNIAGFSSSYAIVTDEKLNERLHNSLQALHHYMGNVIGNETLATAYECGGEWLKQVKLYIQDNVEFVYDYINENMPEVKVIKQEATFLMWLDFRVLNMSHKELTNFMFYEAKVAINDGMSFGKEGLGFMRLNVASPRKTIEEGLKRINNALKKLK